VQLVAVLRSQHQLNDVDPSRAVWLGFERPGFRYSLPIGGAEYSGQLVTVLSAAAEKVEGHDHCTTPAVALTLHGWLS
jgi:hypothetical protein